MLAQWTGTDTPSAELDIVEIAHRRTASAAATDSPGRAKLRSPIHLAALSQTPTTSAIPIASLMGGHHPAPIRHDHPPTATPRATCLDYNAFAMAEAAPDVADPVAARNATFPHRGHDRRAHNTAPTPLPRRRRAAPIRR